MNMFYQVIHVAHIHVAAIPLAHCDLLRVLEFFRFHRRPGNGSGGIRGDFARVWVAMVVVVMVMMMVVVMCEGRGGLGLIGECGRGCTLYWRF